MPRIVLRLVQMRAPMSNSVGRITDVPPHTNQYFFRVTEPIRRSNDVHRLIRTYTAAPHASHRVTARPDESTDEQQRGSELEELPRERPLTVGVQHRDVLVLCNAHIHLRLLQPPLKRV